MQHDDPPNMFTPCEVHRFDTMYEPAPECLPCLRARVAELEADKTRQEIRYGVLRLALERSTVVLEETARGLTGWSSINAQAEANRVALAHN